MAIDLNYGMGVDGKNLVLKTLGKVYVKVKDRKYELLFRPEDLQRYLKQEETTTTPDTPTSILIIDSNEEISDLTYPGDDFFIITKDGHLYFTENDEIVEIPLTFSPTNLTLQNLNITGQITFTGNKSPLVIPTNTLIKNLNADLLDGYHANSFANKSLNETISGNWTFNDSQTFRNAVGLKYLTDYSGNRINIDFESGTITCNTLNVQNLNDQGQTTESEFNIISGIGQEVWIGSQIEIIDKTFIETINENAFYMVYLAYMNNELPNKNPIDGTDWPLEDFWYSKIFFDSWDAAGNYTLKNFDDPTVWNEVNSNFANTGYDLSDYQNLINALKTVNSDGFSDVLYELTIPNNINVLSLLPNMLIKNNKGEIAYIVNRDMTSITVKMKEAIEFSGDSIIVIGSLAQKGGIVFISKNPSLSILNDPLDLNSHSIYFGQLSKVDANKSGIGVIFKGTYPTNIISENNYNDIKDYLHTSEINIENPNLSWGNKINVFNEDGSGYLSNGLIRWTANQNVVINSASIINSTLNNSIISNSSFNTGSVVFNTDGSGNIGDLIQFDSTGITLNSPLGTAGGDLMGNYPNPTIKDNIITTEKLQDSCITTSKILDENVTLNKLGSDVLDYINSISSEDLKTQIEQNTNNIASIQINIGTIESNITTINNSITTINGKIEDLEQSAVGDYTQLEERVTILENTVGTLNTTLENRLNGQ